jgi:hypothetical protein
MNASQVTQKKELSNVAVERRQKIMVSIQDEKREREREKHKHEIISNVHAILTRLYMQTANDRLTIASTKFHKEQQTIFFLFSRSHSISRF